MLRREINLRVRRQLAELGILTALRSHLSSLRSFMKLRSSTLMIRFLFGSPHWETPGSRLSLTEMDSPCAGDHAPQLKDFAEHFETVYQAGTR